MNDPIFIGGEGRSGTTLLSVILDSHANLLCGPELHFRAPENLGPYILKCLELKFSASSIDEWIENKKNPNFYQGINFIIRCNRFGIDDIVLKKMIHEVMDKSKSEISSFVDRCTLISQLGKYNLNAHQATRWGIKIMKDIKIANRYYDFWPKAQFIHLIRDGRDVAASQMKEHRTWGYGDIEVAAKNWIATIERVRTIRNMVPIMEVRYEDLVCMPRKIIGKITKFLMLPWDDKVLAHEISSHSLFERPYNHPSALSVKRSINCNSVGRYKIDLTTKEIDRFTDIAHNYLEELGYI